MSCFHPLLLMRQCTLVPDISNTPNDFPLQVRLKWANGYRPVGNKEFGEKEKYRVRALEKYEYEAYLRGDETWIPKFTMMIPCGHCVGCKLDYSREWADRMLMELQSAQDKGLFVTITYNDDFVPKSKYMDNQNVEHCNYTLRKKDFQDWLKRLRAIYDGKYDNRQKVFVYAGRIPIVKVPVKRNIRYYGAGEYGEMTMRPHGHFILFGLSLEDVKAVPALTPLGDPVVNRNGDPYYNSEVLEKTWPFGLVSVAEVTWRTCAYVARYVTKKWSSGYGDSSNGNLYEIFGVEPEFSLMSRKPGIGSNFFDDWCAAAAQRNKVSYYDDCMLNYSYLSVKSSSEGRKLRIPRYFKKKFRDSDDENLRKKYEECCTAAGLRAEDRIKLKLEKTDLDFISMLEGEQQHLIKQTKILRRDKV